jgi:hypothetical protein
MDTEIKINPSDRYLLCNYVFSNEMIDQIKAEVKAFIANREKDGKYFEFIEWQKTKTEILVLIMYAYNDVSLPKKYNTVFQVDKPDNFVSLDVRITQAVLNGWTAVTQLSRGHKHVCVIQMENTADSIFNLLTYFDPKNTAPGNIELGLCDENDFEEIKMKLKRRYPT